MFEAQMEEGAPLMRRAIERNGQTGNDLQSLDNQAERQHQQPHVALDAARIAAEERGEDAKAVFEKHVSPPHDTWAYRVIGMTCALFAAMGRRRKLNFMTRSSLRI